MLVSTKLTYKTT